MKFSADDLRAMADTVDRVAERVSRAGLLRLYYSMTELSREYRRMAADIDAGNARLDRIAVVITVTPVGPYAINPAEFVRVDRTSKPN